MIRRGDGGADGRLGCLGVRDSYGEEVWFLGDTIPKNQRGFAGKDNFGVGA